MIKLMIADDHVMLRDGLRDKFCDEEGIEVTGEAGTGEELLRKLQPLQPNVIILDLKLPDTNGVTLIRQVKDALPACKVVVLTMYDHTRYATHAMESGADAFVVKGAPFEELLEAVRAVADNRTYISTTMAVRIGKLLKGRKKKGSLEALSEREFQVMILLGSGMSVKEIAYQLNLSEKSITTYRARVMEKLELSSRADLIRYVLEAGLIE